LLQYDEWTPALDTDHAYAYVGGMLSAVNRTTGQVDFTITDPNFSWAGWSMQLAPVLGGMNDVLVINRSRLVRMDLSTKTVLYDINSRFSGQPAVRQGSVYAISAGDLEVRDQITGALQWVWEGAGGALAGSVLVTDSHAIVTAPSAFSFGNA